MIDSPERVIHQVIDSSLNEVKTNRKKFKCINKADLEIWGDYNSKSAQQIAIKFKMCEGYDYCEKKEDIREWLRGKYILLLYNQIRFQTEEYFEEAAVKEAVLQYVPISSQTR